MADEVYVPFFCSEVTRSLLGKGIKYFIHNLYSPASLQLESSEGLVSGKPTQSICIKNYSINLNLITLEERNLLSNELYFSQHEDCRLGSAGFGHIVPI